MSVVSEMFAKRIEFEILIHFVFELDQWVSNRVIGPEAALFEVVKPISTRIPILA